MRVPAAALGRAVPQEDAHDPDAALGRRGLPAVRPAAGGHDRLRVRRRQRRRQAPAHHRALLDHRAPADRAPPPDRAGAGRGRGGLRRVVRRQVPEREQRLPGVRGGSRALPRHVPRVHHRAPTQREAFAKTRTGAVAGMRLVERFGWKLGQKLPISSEIHPKTRRQHELGVRPGRHPRRRGPGGARQHRRGPDQRRLLRRGARSSAKGKTGWYIVRIADSTQARAISAAIDAALHELARRDQDPAREGVRRSASPSRSATSARWSPASWPPCSSRSCILTGNTMAQSIRERIPELAILKTLGFSDGKVTALVLAEAAPAAGPRRRARHGRRPSAMLPGLNGATGGRFPPLFVAPRRGCWARCIVAGAACARDRAAAGAAARAGCGSWTRWRGHR